MKQITILFMALVSLFILPSCEDKVTPSDEPKNLFITSIFDEVPAEGSIVQLTFEASHSWEIISKDEWLEFSAVKGDAGEIEVNITVEANTDNAKRKSVIIVNMSGISQKTLLSQAGATPIPPVEIPDEELKKHLTKSNIFVYNSENKKWEDSGNKIDADADGELSIEELKEIEYLNLDNLKIENLTGIEYMPSLIFLQCANNKIEELDLSKNAKLEYLKINNNLLTELDITECAELQVLNITSNTLSFINLTNNSKLVELLCSGNKLQALDLSKQNALINLECAHNTLIRLDLKACTSLVKLDCNYNMINLLDVKMIPTIEYIDCKDNFISALDFTQNLKLEELYCDPMNNASGNNVLETITVLKDQNIVMWEYPDETKIIIKGDPGDSDTMDGDDFIDNGNF